MVEKIAHTLNEAAEALGISLREIEELRDDGLLISYCLFDGEYVTSHALKDLQHRLSVGACTLGEKLRLSVSWNTG